MGLILAPTCWWRVYGDESGTRFLALVFSSEKIGDKNIYFNKDNSLDFPFFTKESIKRILASFGFVNLFNLSQEEVEILLSDLEKFDFLDENNTLLEYLMQMVTLEELEQRGANLKKFVGM